MPGKPNVFLGIDVQVRRPCAYALLNERATPIDTGWFKDSDDERRAFIAQIRKVAGARRITVGIDAPRMPLPSPRTQYWRGGAWINARTSDKGVGRHCEIVIAALKLANPQYTRSAKACEPWMHLGFKLFELFESAGILAHEVFPSASYRMLKDEPTAVTVGVGALHGGPKDILDAHIAAFTVREFVNGNGWEVGGGDGCGTIVLPRKRTCTSLVHSWPGAVPEDRRRPRSQKALATVG